MPSSRSTTPEANLYADPAGDIVTVHNVAKAFGPHQVLKGVSLSVTKGTAVALIGPSGSGSRRCFAA